jgi:hypothetical protein
MWDSRQELGPTVSSTQLRWDENENSPAWHHKELTSDAGAPLAFFEVRANVHYATGTQHVVYLGLNDQGLLDNQVHDLYADDSNGWSHTNLTTATAGGAPLALTTPTGFEFRTLQHVDYQGTDSHIHELWFDSNGWHHNDLTNAPAVAVGPLTARVFASTATQHVVYRAGTNGSNIQELWWDDNGSWRQSDLTNASQAPAANGEPTNYTFEVQGTQHINYLGSNQRRTSQWLNQFFCLFLRRLLFGVRPSLLRRSKHLHHLSRRAILGSLILLGKGRFGVRQTY